MSPHSRKKPNSFRNLADDVITCILSTLLVESIQRFKIVSKSWCSNIKNPNFIKLQIDKNATLNDFHGHMRWHPRRGWPSAAADAFAYQNRRPILGNLVCLSPLLPQR
ncbi:hypothetical protein RND71_025570 [Anisodus tanguticus]|uniref:F-box domain-containing protein n=1 Tax=Anisodus tanguticus TaxID=243964 RepID=A0AAE1RST8_9SOLA|nr:hypothetical protein RND71_025570 [Anisodus tanguticus]